MKLINPLAYLTPLLTIVLVNFFPLAAQAEMDCTAMNPRPYVEPSVLATMAYRGAFEKEGIPGYGVLETQVKTGSVSGEEVVAAAIKACYLSNQYGMGQNPNFAKDVENQLKALYRN